MGEFCSFRCTVRQGTLPATKLMSSLPWLVWQYDVNSISKGVRNFANSGCVRWVKCSIFRGIFYHFHLWLMFYGVLSIHIDMSDTYYSATMWTTYNNKQFLFLLCLQSSRRWSWMVNGLQTFEGWVTRNFDAQDTYVGIIGLHQELWCIRGVWGEVFLCECTRWGWLRDHPHEQHLPAHHLWSFCPTCSLIHQWQASPTCSVGSEAANPVVSKPGRLRTSEIPMPLSVSLVMMPPRHHLPALPFEIGELRPNWYYFCHRELAHLLYLGITPFCTWSRGLVLNLKVPPTE